MIIIQMTGEVAAQFMRTGWSTGNNRYTVTEGLPADAKLIGAFYQEAPDILELQFESEDYRGRVHTLAIEVGTEAIV